MLSEQAPYRNQNLLLMASFIQTFYQGVKRSRSHLLCKIQIDTKVNVKFKIFQKLTPSSFKSQTYTYHNTQRIAMACFEPSQKEASMNLNLHFFFTFSCGSDKLREIRHYEMWPKAETAIFKQEHLDLRYINGITSC